MIRRLAEEEGERRSSLPMDCIHDVLEFWFSDDARDAWFHPDPEFDQTIRKRFAQLVARAARGELESWQTSAEGCLALCILLDQMPRHMFRGDPRAFATDEQALAVADHALAEGFDRSLTRQQTQFIYMPFMHSENLADQLRALALFESGGMTENRRFAEEHVAIIRRFGRFPHRNAIFGRPSTEAEVEYLSGVQENYGQPSPGPDAHRLP